MAGTPESLQPEVPVVTQVPENVDLGQKATEAGVEQVPISPQGLPSTMQGSATQPAVTPVPAPQASTGPSITIPSDPASLATAAKGSTSNSVTWLAAYWLRMVKKALLRHWNIIVGGGKSGT